MTNSYDEIHKMTLKCVSVSIRSQDMMNIIMALCQYKLEGDKIIGGSEYSVQTPSCRIADDRSECSVQTPSCRIADNRSRL